MTDVTDCAVAVDSSVALYVATFVCNVKTKDALVSTDACRVDDSVSKVAVGVSVAWKMENVTFSEYTVEAVSPIDEDTDTDTAGLTIVTYTGLMLSTSATVSINAVALLVLNVGEPTFARAIVDWKTRYWEFGEKVGEKVGDSDGIGVLPISNEICVGR